MSLGTFYLVASPIGNLADITYRAVEILQTVDFILCEDTRTSSVLLKKYNIKTAKISYHKHSSETKIKQIIDLLESGKNLALISDAGTPNISDPGGYLVDRLRAKFSHDLKIISIPGPSALSATLAIAGSAWDKFIFFGFLPHKKGRQKALKSLFKHEFPAVIYESKHRLLKLLKELLDLEQEFDIKKDLLIARELSKLHESTYFGRPSDLLKEFETDPNSLKGEFVILIKNL